MTYRLDRLNLPLRMDETSGIDLPADTTTVGVLTLDGFAMSGGVSPDDNADWYAITVEAGQTIIFSSIVTSYSFSLQTQLQLIDTDGLSILATDNDDMSSTFRDVDQIIYTFSESGTYYLSVECLSEGYRYSVAATVVPENGQATVVDLMGTQILNGTSDSDIVDLLGLLPVSDRFPATTLEASGSSSLLRQTFDRYNLVLETDYLISIETVQLGPTRNFVRLGDDAPGYVYEPDITIIGGSGNDTISGGSGDNIFRGGEGVDFLTGGSGTNLLDGGEGNDVIMIGYGAGSVDGGAGIDQLWFEDSYVRLTEAVIVSLEDGFVSNTGRGLTASVTNIENLSVSSDFANILEGNQSRNQIRGEAGDTLLGLGGDDVIISGGAGTYDGGDAIDTFIFDAESRLRNGEEDIRFGNEENFIIGDFVFDLAGGVIRNDGLSVSGELSNFENIEIHELDDVDRQDWNLFITGTDGDNRIINDAEIDSFIDAGAGDDTIVTFLGSDRIIGGAGDDLIFSGGGRDTLVLSGHLADYIITENNNRSFTVEGPDGVDTLFGIDRIEDSFGQFETISHAPIQFEYLQDAGGAFFFLDLVLEEAFEARDIISTTQTQIVIGALERDAGTYFVLSGSDFETGFDGDTTRIVSGQIEGLSIFADDIEIIRLSNININYTDINILLAQTQTHSDYHRFANFLGDFILAQDFEFIYADQQDYLGINDGSDFTGNNILRAGVVSTTYSSGIGNDIFFGGSGDDEFYTTGGDNLIYGGAGSDDLSAQDGDDIIYGGDVAPVDAQSDSAQIFRAYQAVFNRAPDAQGFETFSRAVINGDLTQSDIITEFVKSTEFAVTYGDLSNREFVEQLYRNVLNREGDEDGIDLFSAALDGGRSRTDVVIEFANTPEFISVMSVPTRSFLSNVGLDSAEGQVYRIYQTVFNRVPDVTGFQLFVDAIQGNVVTLESVTAEFVASEEFQLTYGDLNTAAFVEQLYANVLPGNTDQVGRQDFINALTAGTLSRADMVAQFADSPEFQLRTLDAALVFSRTIFTEDADRLNGGGGDDVLYGGRDADIFIYSASAGGMDIILDYVDGVDRINIYNRGFLDSFSEIIAAATQQGNDVVFDFGEGNILRLNNVALTALDASDFSDGRDNFAKPLDTDIPVAEAPVDIIELLPDAEPDWVVDYGL